MSFGRRILILAFAVIAFCAASSPVWLAAQGVTTGGIGGVVTGAQKQPVAGASVIAIHEPSGTSYEATTRADGRYSIPAMRVGGPYTVQVVYTGGGGGAFAPKTVENVNVNLGVTSDVNVSVEAITVAEEVEVTGVSDPVFASTRTGAATAVGREDIATLPTISGRSGVGHAAHAAGQRNVVRRPGQPAQQHHRRRLVLQQLVRPRISARRAHQRCADLARIAGAGAGEHCAVRRAPGQLHRRRDQQRHAQRHEPVQRLCSITGCAAKISSAPRRAA